MNADLTVTDDVGDTNRSAKTLFQLVTFPVPSELDRTTKSDLFATQIPDGDNDIHEWESLKPAVRVVNAQTLFMVGKSLQKLALRSGSVEAGGAIKINDATRLASTGRAATNQAARELRSS